MRRRLGIAHAVATGEQSGLKIAAFDLATCGVVNVRKRADFQKSRQRSQPDGNNVILLFLLDLSLFLTGQRSIECISDAQGDSDRPAAVSGSLKTGRIESLQESP